MAAHPLDSFKKQHDFLIGIDSDGCAFDSMEIKHKECFIPNTIQYFGLQAVSKYARMAAEFVNLYSKERGINRFPALTSTLDLLEEWDEVQRRNVKIPRLESVRAWIKSAKALGNPALKEAVEKSGDPDLKLALDWSVEVNKTVDRMVHGVPPFPYVRESLEKIAPKAEIMVCSATPGAALAKEWEEHNIHGYVQAICGQEAGKKDETLGRAASHGYDKARVLMIGDAPGDMQAAQKVGALFYPINPGAEEESWKRFLEDAADRFFKGTFAGKYQQDLIAEFNTYLPELPSWKKTVL